jgi:hypothetical protein
MALDEHAQRVGQAAAADEIKRTFFLHRNGIPGRAPARTRHPEIARRGRGVTRFRGSGTPVCATCADRSTL